MGFTINLDSSGSGIFYKPTNCINYAATSIDNYDHGWLLINGWLTNVNPATPATYARLLSFATLAENNKHGNTERFTYRDGTASGYQSIIGNVVQDHLLGREYYSPSNTAANFDSKLMDPNVAYSNGPISSETGWYMAPITIFGDITYLNGFAYPLSFIPWRNNVANLGSSTSRLDTGNTNRCLVYSYNNKTSPFEISDTAKTTSTHYCLMRKFTEL